MYRDVLKHDATKALVVVLACAAVYVLMALHHQDECQLHALPAYLHARYSRCVPGQWLQHRETCTVECLPGWRAEDRAPTAHFECRRGILVSLNQTPCHPDHDQ